MFLLAELALFDSDDVTSFQFTDLHLFTVRQIL